MALLTPDDLGAHKGEESTLNPRARQKVIFEFGYFIGKLSRKRVCAMLSRNYIRRKAILDSVRVVYAA